MTMSLDRVPGPPGGDQWLADDALDPLPRVLYIDKDDDLSALLDQVEGAGTPAIVVLPDGARAVHGMVAARLLQRRATAAGVTLVAVTTDRTTIAQFNGVGIPTASTVGEARHVLPRDAADLAAAQTLPALDLDDPDFDDALARAQAPSTPAGHVPAPDAVPFAGPADPDVPARTRATPDAPDPPDRHATARGMTGTRPGVAHRVKLWLLAFMLLLVASGVAAWVVLFPQATIVISYTVSTFARTYQIGVTAGGALPLHTTHLAVSGTRTVPATGTTTVPDGHATGTITLANPLDGVVIVPAGTIVTTDSGLTFATLAAVNVPAAVHSFAGTTNGQQSVGIEATQAGMSGNVPAGAIRHMRGRLAGVLLITNYDPTSGGTVRTIYTITPGDTGAAASALRADLIAQAKRTLQKRYARSPARFITSITSEKPVIHPLTRPGALFAQVTLTVHVTMNYVHGEDVASLAAARWKADLASHNLVALTGSEHQETGVTRTGGTIVVTVHVRARTVPTIEVANLRGLLAGRTIDDARRLLDGSAHYGNWSYTLHVSPDLAHRLPASQSLIQITVKQVG